LVGSKKTGALTATNQANSTHPSSVLLLVSPLVTYLIGDGINFVHQIQRVRPFFLWTDESKLSSCPGFLTSTVERVLVHALPPFPAVYGKQRMILSLFVCVFTFDLL
jgi:hypothetical protein